MKYQLSDINFRTVSDPVAFMAESDAAYRSKVEQAADKIILNRKRSPIVLLSGPSGSGKTTTSMKIAEELNRRGIHTHYVALDDYFKTIDETSPRTADGQLVNIDGNGNRVSNLCFGPAHVIVVVSMNKMVPTVEDAYARIRQDACPPNAVRLNLDTPCAKTGFCAECTSTSSICASFVTTRMSRYPDRIKVILVGEPLGF